MAKTLAERARRYCEDNLGTIKLHNISGYGYHGVFEHETREGQEFHLDLTLWVDTKPAADTDGLERTVNYGEIAELAHAHIVGEPRQLIETVAAETAAEILDKFPLVRQVEVTVNKPEAPITVPFENVSVSVKQTAQPVTAVIALGSNIGDTQGYLDDAVKAFNKHKLIDVKAVASYIRTAPVGGVEQDDFLNSALVIETVLPPFELLHFCQELEQRAERKRIVRWGPRTLDVDVIKYGEISSADEELTLPHPRANERAFVLAPWLSIDPDAHLKGEKVRDLLARVDLTGIDLEPLGLDELGN